jgi:hypothetical protein
MLGGAHKPLSGSEVESVIERAAADAVSSCSIPTSWMSRSRRPRDGNDKDHA